MGRTAARGAVRAPLRAGDLAWLAAVLVAALVIPAIAVLGPPLSDLLFPEVTADFWPTTAVVPEPVEHARYLIALTAPLLLTGFVAIGARRTLSAPPRTIAVLVGAAQLLAFAFVAVCLVSQRRYGYRTLGFEHVVYFSTATMWVAAAIALAVGASLASDRVRARFIALTRERRAVQIAGAAIAVAAIAISVMPGLYTEQAVVTAHEAIVEHMPYWLDEVFSVLNGPYPLVGYSAQYGSLLPYPVAGAMALLGPSVGSFTAAMTAINALCMLAAFATLRRVARSTLVGLVLFLPFLATSFFTMEGPPDNRYATVNLFSTFPLRYAGPLVLLWLVARHLDGASPRATRWLFLVAGLAVLNNGDFGIPALGATVAALLWSPARPAWRRLALEAAAGAVGALVAVSALTLLVAGSLPDLTLLFRFSGVFVLSGFGMWPLEPTIGMSTIVYLTYVAAIAVATVRLLEGAPDRLMTGLLAWSGVFGLGAGSYFVGRSHPEVLTNMFPIWALTIILLFVLSVRAIAARTSHRPTLAEAVCLLAFGVLVCSLPQTPKPWSQVDRLQTRGEPLFARPLGQPFIAAQTSPGEAVAILTELGHRAAYDLRIRDVNPYAGAGAMPTVEQLDDMLHALRAAGGRKVFLYEREIQWPGIADALTRRGYLPGATERYGMTEYVRRG